MNRDNKIIFKHYQNIQENTRGLKRGSFSPLQKLGNIIQGWSWQANKPSPQTGKYYPSIKKFSDNTTQKKIGEMMDKNYRVLPRWREDFDACIGQWLRDMIQSMNPKINQIKDIIGIAEDINKDNQPLYSQGLQKILAQMNS
jgi:hypothetical protein